MNKFIYDFHLFAGESPQENYTPLRPNYTGQYPSAYDSTTKTGGTYASNQDLFHMVRKAEMWLHDNTWTTPIYKWDTKAWGEIPADFGRK